MHRGISEGKLPERDRARSKGRRGRDDEEWNEVHGSINRRRISRLINRRVGKQRYEPRIWASLFRNSANPGENDIMRILSKWRVKRRTMERSINVPDWANYRRTREFLIFVFFSTFSPIVLTGSSRPDLTRRDIIAICECEIDISRDWKSGNEEKKATKF